MAITVTRTGTGWTVDVTALALVPDTAEKDFLVTINNEEQSLASFTKTSATVLTYTGAPLVASTSVTIYRWGLRAIDQLFYGEVTSQLGMNQRLVQIERALDDIREVKLSVWQSAVSVVGGGPEVVVASVPPSAVPNLGEKFYVESDTGDYWVLNAGVWGGPYGLAPAERTKLAGIAAGAQVNTVNSVAGKTGAVTLAPEDVGAATAAQGTLASTALQPASPLNAANLTGIIPLGSIPAAVATDAEVAAAILPLSLSAPVPVSNVITVPFNAASTIMAAYTIVGAISFSAGTPTVAGAVTTIPVIANGANVPTFSGITMLANSLPYDNRSGVRNVFQFTYDGTTTYYQILRAATPALTGLTTVGVNFSTSNGNFTVPSAGVYSSSSATAFSGWGGSAVSIPAGKDFQLQSRMSSTTMLAVHNNNTTAAIPSSAQTWLYQTWNAAGTLYTAEGTTQYASAVTGVSGFRYFQIKRIGSQVTISSKVNIGDAWTLIGTMPTPSSTALFIMLATTGTFQADSILLEVQQ